MIELFSNRNCWRCETVTLQELVREQRVNGAWVVGYHCLTCLGWTGNGECKNYWLKHESLKAEGIEIELLRVIGMPIEHRPCIICGEQGSEHHWAPQCVRDQFEEHSKWPTAFLCQRHHTEWHRIVTPDYALLMRNNPPRKSSIIPTPL